MTAEVRREYVEARRVLLDALTGLRPHIKALVLIGAQAVYLRTIDRLPGYQPYTTDADLVLDPARLADEPLLADAMTSAGFVFSGAPGIWHRSVVRSGEDDAIVPVDLIVPQHVAPSAGRRGARLPGGHGRTAAQKTQGVEGALVDRDPIEIAALEITDIRTVVVEVAGPAALLVAKAFKLGERVDNPRRFLPKDAGDVFRLYEAYDVEAMVARLSRVTSDERSAEVTERALTFLHMLFATPRLPASASRSRRSAASSTECPSSRPWSATRARCSHRSGVEHSAMARGVRPRRAVRAATRCARCRGGERGRRRGRPAAAPDLPPAPRRRR